MFYTFNWKGYINVIIRIGSMCAICFILLALKKLVNKKGKAV